MWGKLQKYGFIGMLNVAVDFSIYSLCVALLDMKAIIAHILAWSVAVQFSYLMNSFFTFKQTKVQILRLKLWFKFIISNCFVLFFSSLTLYIFLPLLGIYGAKIVAIIISYGVGFILSQFFVFKEKT